eukprot:UN09084
MHPRNKNPAWLPKTVTKMWHRHD